MAFQVSKSGDVTVIDVEGQLIVGNRQELKQNVLDGGLFVAQDSSRRATPLVAMKTAEIRDANPNFDRDRSGARP